MEGKWNLEKLEQMTQQENGYIKTKLNYVYLAENFNQIVKKTRNNGDVVPLAFDDVKIAYDGDPLNDMDLEDMPEECMEKYEKLENNRKVMHIKHFSRDLSHEDWFKFLDGEIAAFIEKYPEFANVIKK